MYLNTGELGVLDFGCARRTSAERTDNYLRLLQALWAEDGQALLELYQSLDFARGEAVLSPEALLRFNQIALAPFVGEGRLTGRGGAFATTSSGSCSSIRSF